MKILNRVKSLVIATITFFAIYVIEQRVFELDKIESLLVSIACIVIAIYANILFQQEKENS